MIARYALAAALAFAAMAFFSARTALIDKGERKAVAKVEKRNDAVRKKARAAAKQSADPKSAGVRLPYERD
jgi:hypothetical protein